jgi:hypothetical protein
MMGFFYFEGTLCADAKGLLREGGEHKSQVLAGAGAGGAGGAEPDDASFKIAYATICPERAKEEGHITKKRKVKEGKTRPPQKRRKETKKEKREREREREEERERSILLRKFGFV